MGYKKVRTIVAQIQEAQWLQWGVYTFVSSELSIEVLNYLLLLF